MTDHSDISSNLSDEINSPQKMRRDHTLNYQENGLNNINNMKLGSGSPPTFRYSQKRGNSPKSSKINQQTETIAKLRKALSTVIDENDKLTESLAENEALIVAAAQQNESLEERVADLERLLELKQQMIKKLKEERRV